MGVRFPPGALTKQIHLRGSVLFGFVWRELNAGAMFCDAGWRAKPRGGGQSEEAEADERRGLVSPCPHTKFGILPKASLGKLVWVKYAKTT